MDEVIHTPGPWATCDDELIGPDDPVVIYNVDEEGFAGCEICEVYAHPDLGDRNQNARLIMAAPRLLAVLEEVLPYAVKYIEALNAKMSGSLYPAINAAMIARAEAAISEAKGEAT